MPGSSRSTTPSIPKKTLKECIRNFVPAWFTVNMGTGVLSALAARFHFGAGSLPLEIISLVYFFLNLFLFIVFCVITAARYIMFPDVWHVMFDHPSQSMFLGAFPMGFATLINSALTANQSWGFGGVGFLYTLWGFWWLDLALSMLVCFTVLYTMMTSHRHSLTKMAASWLLPIVTLVVASSTGGLLGAALEKHSKYHALISTAVSLTALLIGLSLTFMILTVYLTRLILYGPPDISLILSAFVALGPLGQGGFSLLINGSNMADLLPVMNGNKFPFHPLTGELIYSACFCGAWVLWSMGLTWILISLSSLWAVLSKHKVPFSLGYWGLIFPNGVFSLLTVQLGVVLESPFFNYFGAIWSIITLILWICIFIATIPFVWKRSIFVAPCLASNPVMEVHHHHQPSREKEPESMHPTAEPHPSYGQV